MPTTGRKAALVERLREDDAVSETCRILNAEEWP